MSVKVSKNTYFIILLDNKTIFQSLYISYLKYFVVLNTILDTIKQIVMKINKGG